jgi:hypothetical protein
MDPGFSPRQIWRETLRALVVPAVFLFSGSKVFVDVDRHGLEI